MDIIPSPKYKPGDQVRVGTDAPPGHIRTPSYIRGKLGRVVKLWGVFLNPELLAFGKPGFPKQPLYQIEFDQKAVWETYNGPPGDKLRVDIYQHWLEQA